MRDQQAENGSPNARVGPLQCEEKKEKMNEGKRAKTGRPGSEDATPGSSRKMYEEGPERRGEGEGLKAYLKK